VSVYGFGGWQCMACLDRFWRFGRGAGDPLARLLASHGRGNDPYPLMDELRAQGPLVHTPFTWVSVDHGVCREILRDKRFGVTGQTEMVPRPLRALISRTDPGVPNPVDKPAIGGGGSTRAHPLPTVGGAKLHPARHRHAEHAGGRGHQGIDRPDRRHTQHPDLIADFAAQLPVAIIAEILDLPVDVHPRMLELGPQAAPHCWMSENRLEDLPPCHRWIARRRCGPT